MNWYKFPYPLVATLAFFIVGYSTNGWSYAWLVFLTVPLYYGVVRAMKPSQKSRDDDRNKSEKSEKWSDF